MSETPFGWLALRQSCTGAAPANAAAPAAIYSTFKPGSQPEFRSPLHVRKQSINILVPVARGRDSLQKGRRIRELTAVVQKRFAFPENSVELFAERVENRASCAMAQAESLRYKLLGGLAVRRTCYGVVRFIMENGAKGCEVPNFMRCQVSPTSKHKWRRILPLLPILNATT